jgi:hypothetical protein
MKTDILIKDLAQDLKPWRPLDSLNLYTLKWFSISLLIFGICAWLMPWRLDFTTALESFMYHLENFLWVVIALGSAFALHESAFPESDTRPYKIICGISLAILMGLAFKEHSSDFLTQWAPEMDLCRGRCGFIISGFAILETPFLVYWAKRGAPRSAGLSGLYAALSSASLGCLLMQMICMHHNSLHMILWHFLPLSMMCFIGFMTAKRFLRW